MSDYSELRRLETDYAYKVLEALWLHQVAKIEEGRDKAAQRGSETAWRYWAGQEKGFKLAMTALQRALVEMEKNAEEEKESPAGDYVDLIAGLNLPGERKV